MPLDPLSALSVAACVVQFVDFAAKIVSKGRDIYSSPDGVLEENSFAETVTIRLKEKANTVETSLRSADTITIRSMKARSIAEARDEQLKVITKDCSELCQALLDKLAGLKVPKGSEHRRWKSFRQALKTVWSKQEIENIAGKLKALRSELDSEVMEALRQGNRQCWGRLGTNIEVTQVILQYRRLVPRAEPAFPRNQREYASHHGQPG
jgi:hypothetical protein